MLYFLKGRSFSLYTEIWIESVQNALAYLDFAISLVLENSYKFRLEGTTETPSPLRSPLVLLTW